MNYQIMKEDDLCKELNLCKNTLRVYLQGWKFAKVLKRRVWYLKPNARRKSLTYEYTLTDLHIKLLKDLRYRKCANYE